MNTNPGMAIVRLKESYILLQSCCVHVTIHTDLRSSQYYKLCISVSQVVNRIK
jgi:hypothetical protein